MNQPEDMKKLAQSEYYECPLPHVHPRRDQAFFKSFDAHFSAFKSRDDHFDVLKLHEELAWEYRRSESEKRNLNEDDLRRISLKAWLEAIRRRTGQSIRIIVRK